jgi:DNA-binding MarR family transcriptional regulator
MATDPFDELADAFVIATRALVGIAIRSVGATSVDVTVAQHRVLLLLLDDPVSVGTIAQHLGVNPSNATRLCDRLQRLDLVERSRSTGDGRTVWITITPAGRRLVDAVYAYRRNEVTKVLRSLSSDQVQAAVEAMTAFNQAARELAETESDGATW